VTAIAPTSLLEPSQLLPFEQLEPSLQQRFQQAWQLGSPLPSVIYPETQEQLSEVMKLAKANQWQVVPWGAGSKIHWGGIGKAVDLIISTQRINQVIEHAAGDLTITVEAGITLAQVNEFLAPHNQFLAFDPAYPNQATIGGIIATADTGSWRHRYGGVRDRLIGLSFIRSDGEIAKAGGRVVKNVAGYDLMKLFIGSYGSLGILSQATFRLYPIPESSATVVLSGNPEAIAQATQTLLNSSLTPTALDLRPQNDQILLIARFQSTPLSVQEQAKRVSDLSQALGLSAQIYEQQNESQLWATWQHQLWETHPQKVICKLGIRPTEVVNLLLKIEQLAQVQSQCVLHTRTGLGILRCNQIRSTQLLELRSYLTSHGGFLSILEAPPSLKKSLDVWGYTGNALKIMQNIKHQFDPDNLLSGDRFIQ